MIIKIKGFKAPAYGTLLNYILHNRDRLFDVSGKSFLMSRNLKGNDIPAWIVELKQNESRRINHRKNQVYLTHETLSWHPQDSNKITLRKMQKMVREYMRLRGGDRAVWVAAPHFDRKHFHCHILVGAVDRAGKSMRMSQAELNELKAKAQAYYIEKYPELERSAVRHGAKRNHKLIVEKESQVKRRNKQKTIREEVVEKVKQSAKYAYDESMFIIQLTNAGLKPYSRAGKLCGIEYCGRKFRLKRLGIDFSKHLTKANNMSREEKVKYRNHSYRSR